MARFLIAVFAALLVCFNSPAQSVQKTFEKASESLKAGNYAGAEAGFLKVLKSEPNNVGALGNLGVVYSRTLRQAKAIEIYKHALRLNPRDQGILLNLGLVYVAQEDYQRARPYLQRLHRLDPHRVQATNLLATSFVYGGEADPSFSDVHRELGKVYISLRRYEEAEKEIREALQVKPDDPTAMYLIGAVYVESGKYAESVPYFERELKVTPDAWAGAMYLGKAKQKLGDHAAAVTSLQLAAQLNPDEASIFYLLGISLKALGRTEEARVAFRRVNELHADYLNHQKKTLEELHVVGTR